MSFLDEVELELERDRAPALRAQRQIGCALIAVFGAVIFCIVAAGVMAALLLAKLF